MKTHRYNDIERRLARIDAKALAVDRLQQAMELCSSAPGLPGPNYACFQAWIIPQLVDEQRLLRLDPSHPLASTLLLAVFLRLIDLSRVLHGAEKVGERPSVESFNKLKLLYSLQLGDERGRQVANALLAREHRDDFIDNVESATPAELRLWLFAAMGRERAQDAAYIMGYLQRKTLDDGEHDFLHALTRFESGDLAAAIRLSDRVPASSIDAARSAYLSAKANAMLGQTLKARERLEKTGVRLSTCQWLHLLELAAYNCGMTEAQAMVEGLMPTTPLGVSSLDNGYSEWALFHVRVVVGALERLAEMGDALKALSHSEDIADVGDQDIFNRDPVLKRAQLALVFHAKLSPEEPMLGGTELLIPLFNQGHIGVFRTWCEMQFRLDQHQLLVEQFAPIWSSGRLDIRKEAELVGLAYQAALICGHPLAGVLRVSLDSIELGIGAKLAIATSRQHLVAGLTTIGRLSYLDAFTALDEAVESNALWRDCSLIALGFFRVIEIEMNDKIVRPAAQTLDFAAMRDKLPLLSEKQRRVWKAQLDQIESTINESHKGLMLGQLRELLRIASGPVPAAELALQTPVQRAIELTLTAEGRAALADGRLQAVIASDHVQRFRNPPAHGSFIKLKDAQACEALVTSALSDFRQWFRVFG
ncbi:hypothetical protein [Rhizobium rhizogenes]|uniref:hypothetical protein n=1 Tax=Rhizobium rhizogenes TaxID=359 RepID=UPI00157390E1|nr:hypothetical protein [Rhizobium rhizogenes]NTI33396.1 hypothetical protein [Rhizobium rhizogenes]WEO65095.1 hypothetical protein G6L54_019000 [Rhizobium rhizogenes]